MSPPATPPAQSQEDEKRALLLVPCETKAHLHRWIEVYLGHDLPDAIVDPSSNCTPMDMVFECYSEMRRNNALFDRVLFYAARDAFKTLSQSILEVLALYHLERDIVHLAAIEDQSLKSKEYLRRFISRPYLRDYVVTDSKRTTNIVRYRSDDGTVLTPGQYEALSEADRVTFKEVRNYVQIVVGTVQSCNGQHAPLMCLDEIDVMEDVAAYEEAKMIPSGRDGKPALTILTSSRKFAFGLVQKEIDKAAKTGLQIRHWNYIDVTRACEPARHLPAEPKVPIYVSDERLAAISSEEFERLTDDEKQAFTLYDAYAGCVRNCSLFAMCKGRLATRQTSRSPLLKEISQTISQFKNVDEGRAKAQLLCWKPSTEGLVYPRLNPEVHLITAAQMAEKITGERHDPKLQKWQLVQIMVQRRMQFSSGMDFGYSHNFAVPTAGHDGYRMFFIDSILQPELEPAQMIDVCEKRIKALSPTIYADPENPQLIKMFRRAGFRMRDWTKGPGSVMGGIQIFRMKLSPSLGQPHVFFLRGDAGCELLFEHLSKYRFKLDKSGEVTDIPHDEMDDGPDGARYVVMNVFAPKGEIRAGNGPGETRPPPSIVVGASTEGWMNLALRNAGVDPASVDRGGATKSGGIVWTM